jgi:uncharacterized protein YggE
MPPDCIEIGLGLKALHRDYGEAMRMAGQSLEDIRLALKDVGLRREDIRTTRFSVTSRYDQRQERYMTVSQSVFTGYEIANQLIVEVDEDSARLGRILSAIATCPVNPQISIRYKLWDEPPLKAQLLKSAVQDAKAKAAVLAESAGLTLGEIVNVEYNWGEVRFQYGTYVMESAPAAGAYGRSGAGCG